MGFYRRIRERLRQGRWERNWQDWARQAKEQLQRRLRVDPPRVAFVKQDVQNDLYCCPQGSTPKEIVGSSLMRSGPVGLFSMLNADFYVLNTVESPECDIWKQPAADLGWWSLDELYALQKHVPGKDFGQSDFAVHPSSVDWSQYDLVISVDCAVPSEVTRAFPSVCWGYCIREPKTASYGESMKRPLEGQDFFMTQLCPTDGLTYEPHIIHAPYYLQYHGCFHRLFDRPTVDSDREGIALEHHTVKQLAPSDIEKLSEFGSLRSTAGTPEGDLDRSSGRSPWQPLQWYENLISRKYFLQMRGTRVTWGNAVIESVSAGCLLVGDPGAYGTISLSLPETSGYSIDEVAQRMRHFDEDEDAYHSALTYQRSKVDYLCFDRPVLDMFARMDQVKQRAK